MTLTITLEVKTVGDLERLSKALAPFLLSLGNKPATEPDTTCPLHNVPWQTWTKNGKTWAAHRQGNGWCRKK